MTIAKAATRGARATPCQCRLADCLCRSPLISNPLRSIMASLRRLLFNRKNSVTGRRGLADVKIVSHPGLVLRDRLPKTRNSPGRVPAGRLGLQSHDPRRA